MGQQRTTHSGNRAHDVCHNAPDVTSLPIFAAMDYSILSTVVHELEGVVTGCRVERLYGDAAGNIRIIFIRNRKKLPLLLSPDRALPRLHLESKKPADSAGPSVFVQYLRSRLSGSIVSGVGLLNEDRIAVLHFKKAGQEYRLIFELFGHSANLLLIDRASTILAVYRPVPPGQDVIRPLAAGMPYTPPEKPEQSERLRGSDLSEDIKESASEGDFPVNNLVEEWYGKLVRQRRQEYLRRQIFSTLKHALAWADRKVRAIEQDYRSAGQAEEYRRAGELILGNMKSITRGLETVDLADFEGQTFTVALDPQLSPALNAERYFRKYKKAKAGIGRISGRLAAAREELSALQKLSAELDAAADIDLLSDLHEKVSRTGTAAARAAGSRKKGTQTVPVYRTFEVSGWEILVGRSAAGNDELTMKLARPEDVWLHAEGIPGSHVLIRSRAGADIPQTVLLRAASLAARFSRGKSETKVPVTYTRAKFVKKPRGAKPGAVTLSRRRTIVVKPANDV